MSQQVLVQTGLAGLGLATNQTYAALAAQAATLVVILPYSRTQESEADHIGLVYMAEAGYDPRESIALWENFESFGGERPPEFLSTHPAPGSRIENLRQLLPEVMPIYEANRQKQ
jgi:predicted Zn-dependent protease